MAIDSGIKIKGVDIKLQTKNKIPPVSESVEQICLFRWASFASGTMPELDLMFHVPNGGFRNITTAKRLKAEGVKAGVPDICLPVPRGKYHGLFVELKIKGNKTTKNQDNWIKALQQQGYFVAVCYGWEQAKEVIEKYLIGN